MAQKIIIGGKPVYIVEEHHHVLQAWAEIRQSLPSPPALLTLDHHTDTDDPFYKHCYTATSTLEGEAKEAAMEAMATGLLAKIQHGIPQTVDDAIRDLKNDEHITTATQSDIISRAFVVTLSQGPYSEPGALYVAGAPCAIGCAKGSHADCQAEHAAQVLESIYLDHELQCLNGIAQADGFPAIEAEPYILDIDLDYFHSEQSIEPNDTATFYRLVRNAEAITIATEPEWVEGLRIRGSEITGASLLDRMKWHIKVAMPTIV